MYDFLQIMISSYYFSEYLLLSLIPFLSSKYPHSCSLSLAIKSQLTIWSFACSWGSPFSSIHWSLFMNTMIILTWQSGPLSTSELPHCSSNYLLGSTYVINKIPHFGYYGLSRLSQEKTSVWLMHCSVCLLQL